MAAAGARSWQAVLGTVASAVVVLVALAVVSAASAKVLLVGSYHGIPGKFKSIQAAVDAARAGDWILVGPGDYHEQADHRATPAGSASRAPIRRKPLPSATL